jgi:hypothetical protein
MIVLDTPLVCNIQVLETLGAAVQQVCIGF